MKLSLDAAPVRFDATHPETGIGFTLQSLSPRMYSELQNKSRGKDGAINVITFAANVDEYIIVDWHRPDPGNPEAPGVDAECTPENKRAFGEKFAFSIHPWLLDQAMALERQRANEVKSAKKG